jgi:hypothetical protein
MMTRRGWIASLLALGMGEAWPWGRRKVATRTDFLLRRDMAALHGVFGDDRAGLERYTRAIGRMKRLAAEAPEVLLVLPARGSLTCRRSIGGTRT